MSLGYAESSSFAGTPASYGKPLIAKKTAHTGPLTPVSFESLNDQELFEKDIWERRNELRQGIDDNITFFASSAAVAAYKKASTVALDPKLVRASLERFRYLLVTARSANELRGYLQKEFQLYRSVGFDGAGKVKFTGYFQPVYRASRVRTSEFTYPVFRLPTDFESWAGAHPTRTVLEGYDGRSGILRGLELAWLKTRYEAFMIHVQGSAILEFSDGTSSAIGFAAGTEHPFRGISRDFLKKHRVAWGNLAPFFAQHPRLLNEVLSKNNRFIFFKELDSPDPQGSLGVPVRPKQSIATDKLKLPPGAIGVIKTLMPRQNEDGQLTLHKRATLVLDQDTGSAIKGPGRVDLFMGTGERAQREANMVYSQGELYYFLLNAYSQKIGHPFAERSATPGYAVDNSIVSVCIPL
jgi:membrane-bound lytic murein transglycosylase A